MPDELRRLAQALSDEEFERVYGPVAAREPADAVRLLDGLDAPWWIVGGWAIQAFTGVDRSHRDLDVGMLERDVSSLVEHLAPTHQAWAVGGGMLCPILAPNQELPDWMHQIWVREDASRPWLLDIILAPDRDGRWVFTRDPSYDDDIANVTWIAADGLRYQRPEVTLAFKAALNREKDQQDLDETWPLLDASARAWLTETVARLHPDHEWLDRIG